MTRFDFIQSRRRRTSLQREIDRLLEINLADRLDAELAGRAPPPRLIIAELEAAPPAKPAGGGHMAAPDPVPVMETPPVPHVAGEPARRIVKLDLRNAPSSMETLAESWRRA